MQCHDLICIIFISVSFVAYGGLSIDKSNRKVYWSDMERNAIYRADMDGGIPQIETFIAADLVNPQSVVVDWRNE